VSVKLKYQFLVDAYPELLERLDELIQKAKVSNRFENIHISQDEINHLSKAAELCELKIIELWDQQDTEEFKALCTTYFDIASQSTVHSNYEYYIYERIKLIAFGYLGEHWHFVSQYLQGNSFDVPDGDATMAWSTRVLSLSYKALEGLITRKSWQDISHSVDLINRLRKEQTDFENEYLNEVNEESRPYGAAELVSMYHFVKCIDILGQYLIEGRPNEPENRIHYHIRYSLEFAEKSGNISLMMLYQFFEGLADKMIKNTIWHTTRGMNHWISEFNEFIAKKDDKGVFELLYPQRESLINGQLLDPAHRAIVVNLPTSSGKTMIAEYRILAALNQFKERGGWVAYVVPTKTLVNQVYLQLNRDLGEVGLKIEKVSGAIELDGFETTLLENDRQTPQFDVLVTTYEKLNLLVRQDLGTTDERPLVLTVVDEAHNIEDANRGLNLEFLLTTINNDCSEANFLLMTPDISNSRDIAQWLARDRGKDIHLNLHWWQPNERIVGAIKVEGGRREYDFVLQTLSTQKGTYQIGEEIPLEHFEEAELTWSQVKNSKKQIVTTLTPKLLDRNSPLIVLAEQVRHTYDIAEKLYQQSDSVLNEDDDIELLKKFIESELGTDFPLKKYLDKGIAVHSSGLPGDIRYLVEDLMVQGKIRALAATTTIAQGINFPVSTILVGSYNYPMFGPMPVRDFWNLAGRVGRTGQDKMGWIGIAARDENDLAAISRYVIDATRELSSQLSSAIQKAIEYEWDNLERLLYIDENWSSILQYISHLRCETDQLEQFLAELEQNLEATLGYRELSSDKKRFFRGIARDYAESIDLNHAKQSDSTGFSTVSVRQMIGKLQREGLSRDDWDKNQLFSEQNQSLRNLVGIMMNTYEIRKSIEKITSTGESITHDSISRLISRWVNGATIDTLAQQLYPQEQNENRAIQLTTRALYSVIANAGTWGLAALQKMPTSGLDWENMSENEIKRLANIPAYLHYGVNTDEGVLMRKNNVPRSIANQIGKVYKDTVGGDIFNQPTAEVSNWLTSQAVTVWEEAKPVNSLLSGSEYQKIWKKLNGIQ
jgi:hypothetical protein